MAGSLATWRRCSRRGRSSKSAGPKWDSTSTPPSASGRGSIPKCKDLCPIQLKGVAAEDQVKLVPHDHIGMLGVPLGSVKFNSEFVEKKLMKRVSRTVTALSEFEDSQAAFYLLRVSYSIVRAVHFMRTTPLEHWRDHAKSFDKLMRKAVETILGTPLPEHSYKQSCLTPKLGGMGMRKVEEHADVAFHASWHEARLTSKEEGWTPPAGVPAEYTPQAGASSRSTRRLTVNWCANSTKRKTQETLAASFAVLSPMRAGL